MRALEIGPGAERLAGFETFNITPGPFTDHVGDARTLPFRSGTYDLVYSSHCIEHFEWFEVEAVIAEWARVLKPGGTLEIHTVNALDLMKSLIAIEYGGGGRPAGKWRTDMHQGDPYKWAAGRIMSYAKKGDRGVNLHRAILTPGYLRRCFEQAGITELEEVAEPRGSKKHRGINMGLKGVKR